MLKKGGSATSSPSTSFLAAISSNTSDQSLLSRFKKIKYFQHIYFLFNVHKGQIHQKQGEKKIGFNGLWHLIFFFFIQKWNKAFLWVILTAVYVLILETNNSNKIEHVRIITCVLPNLLPDIFRILKSWVQWFSCTTVQINEGRVAL